MIAGLPDHGYHLAFPQGRNEVMFHDPGRRLECRHSSLVFTLG